MTITNCRTCDGKGFIINVKGNGFSSIPCITCNTRGKVSSELYDETYSKIKGKTLVL